MLLNEQNIKLRAEKKALETMYINQGWTICALLPHNEPIPPPRQTKLNEVLLRHHQVASEQDLASATVDTMRKEIVALNLEMKSDKEVLKLQGDKIHLLLD